MTKIEQWQEWKNQYDGLQKEQEELQNKLDKPLLEFVTNGGDNENLGHVECDRRDEKLLISTSIGKLRLPVYAGKELLSVLKQLYE